MTRKEKETFLKFKYQVLPSCNEEIIKTVHPICEFREGEESWFWRSPYRIKVFAELGSLSKQIEYAFNNAIQVVKESEGSEEAVLINWLRYLSVKDDNANATREIFSYRAQGSNLSIAERIADVIPMMLEDIFQTKVAEANLCLEGDILHKCRTLFLCRVLWYFKITLVVATIDSEYNEK